MRYAPPPSPAGKTQSEFFLEYVEYYAFPHRMLDGFLYIPILMMISEVSRATNQPHLQVSWPFFCIGIFFGCVVPLGAFWQRSKLLKYGAGLPLSVYAEAGPNASSWVFYPLRRQVLANLNREELKALRPPQIERLKQAFGEKEFASVSALLAPPNQFP